ncbi:MAG: hypothetical protein ACM32E_15595 [Gemmatimonadota bacterium]
MAAGRYESWFLSARDPDAERALWIRHTRHRPRSGPGTAALWCTVAGPGQRPVAVKQVFAAFPPDAAAGPGRFRGAATLAGQPASWDLTVTAGEAPLRPLRPALLERAPLPRTKLVASVPDGLVSGTLTAAGQEIAVAGWRGTVGHNWGSEHADRWVWLHADSFPDAPGGWLELVLARIRVGRARSPWTAMGALGLGGQRVALGGLGRRVRASVRPGGLRASVPAAGGRLELTVTSRDEDAVAVPYADPSGGSRTVRHALLASVSLTLHRRGQAGLALATSHGAYEYGTSGSSQDLAGLAVTPLPAG